MNSLPEILRDLRIHLSLSRELLTLAERESNALRDPNDPGLSEIYETKKDLLPHLNQSLDNLRKHRAAWQDLSLAERAQYPEIGSLLRENQDLIMKIIVLDRENEQILLRRGLIPARELPPVNSHRPCFVGQLYQRQSGL